MKFILRQSVYHAADTQPNCAMALLSSSQGRNVVRESEQQEMQTIGLIGGMSWESTAVYYRRLNEQVREPAGRPSLR